MSIGTPDESTKYTKTFAKSASEIVAGKVNKNMASPDTSESVLQLNMELEGPIAIKVPKVVVPDEITCGYIIDKPTSFPT
jgi:hypothetical protein